MKILSAVVISAKEHTYNHSLTILKRSRSFWLLQCLETWSIMEQSLMRRRDGIVCAVSVIWTDPVMRLRNCQRFWNQSYCRYFSSCLRNSSSGRETPDISCHQERWIRRRLPISFWDRRCLISIMSCAMPCSKNNDLSARPLCDTEPKTIEQEVWWVNLSLVRVAHIALDYSWSLSFLSWKEIGNLYTIPGTNTAKYAIHAFRLVKELVVICME